MTIRGRLGAIFAFNTVPTTILLVLIYAAIFSTVLITDKLPPVPRNTRGLDLDRAWLDLHQVSRPLSVTVCVDLAPQDIRETSSL